MIGMSDRIPESLTALAAEFVGTMICLWAIYRFKWNVGGIRHDGTPLGRFGIATIVIAMLAIFVMLAAITVFERRHAGLPIF